MSFQQDEQEREEGISEGSPRLSGERRKSIPPKRLDPPLGGGGTKPRKPKEPKETEPKLKSEAVCDPMINPRTKQPYKRGPYNLEGGAVRPLKTPKGEAKGDKDKHALIDLTKDHKAELGTLQAKVDELQKEIMQLNQNLSEQKAKVKLLKKNSKDAVGFAHAQGRLEQTSESTKMFQMGLQAGMQMSKGECPNFPMMDVPAPAPTPLFKKRSGADPSAAAAQSNVCSDSEESSSD
jgi:hypothetical protein